jgi:signal transduction histidine kinase
MKKLIAKYIEPTALVSWPVFGITFGWAILVNFLDTLNNSPGLVLERISAIGFLHVLLFAMLFVGLKLTQNLNPVSRAFVMVTLVFVFTALRGLGLALIFSIIRGDDLSGIAFRLISSMPVIGLPILIAGVVLHQIRGYSRTRQAILDERERVARLSLETQRQIQELSEVRVSAVKDLILSSLAGNEITSSAQTAEAIENTVENVVRPLSHQLEKESGLVVEEAKQLSNTKLDWAEAIRSAFTATHINPKAVAFTFLITASTRLIFFHSPLEALYLLSLALFGSWGLLWLLKNLLARIPRQLPAALSSVLFTLGVATAGLVIGIATLPASTNSPQPLSLVFQAPFFLFTITALLALASSTQAEAVETNKRLEQTTTELTWEVARLLDEHRQLKRQLAKSLHGPIQSQLMSSLIRISKSNSSAEGALDEIRHWLEKEFQGIQEAMRSGQVRSPKSIQEIFAEVGLIWEGVAEIKLNGTASDASLLSLDPRLMVTLEELIPELSFNAVKHGGASSLVFDISFSDSKTLLLSCLDNGTRPADKSRIGLGTKLLDECAIRWRRYSQDQQTTTEIELPFSNTSQLATA